MNGMNNKIRRKLVLVIMVSVAVVMSVIFFAMNFMNHVQMTRRADEMITLIEENNGTVPEYRDDDERETENIPDQISHESPYQTRFFIVQYDNDLNILDINLSHIAAISYDEADELADSVLDSKKRSGYSGIYRYKVQDTDFGKTVIFLDCSINQQLSTSMVLTSLAIAIISMFAIFIVIWVFSSRFIRPIIENMEKQKRFITDAGHELKTPLAIINANVEVLELMEGSNEWFDSIKNQVLRLDKLIKSMLQLAKMEETSDLKQWEIFNLSDIFDEVTGSFEVLAQQKNKSLKINQQQGIMMSGNKESIRNLISILMDNAIKYCTDGGKIAAKLSVESKNIKIRIKNTAERSDDENLTLLFDRFYRPDTSRSRESGGFGIGLSMAKNITEIHHGKISAQRDGDYVCFTVTFKAHTAKNLL